MNIHRFSSIDETIKKAGDFLNDLICQYQTGPVLLMLSGGSAFKLLEGINVSNIGDLLTIAMLDDRFSQEKEINNFLQFQATEFFEKAALSGCNFFGSLPREGETINDVAKRMEANLRTWKTLNPRGIILATLGMGADGHTAGIFPVGSEKEFNSLFNGTAWMAGYDAGDKNQFSKRITATFTFLKLIDNGIIFVCGQDKKEKLDLVLSNKGIAKQLPAIAWHSLKRMDVFTNIY